MYPGDLDIYIYITEGETPLFGTQFLGGGGVRRHAVRKGSVRNTHFFVVSNADIKYYFLKRKFFQETQQKWH